MVVACPSEEVFVLVLAGRATQAESTTFHRHCELCASCASVLRAMSSQAPVPATAISGTHATLGAAAEAPSSIVPGMRIHQYELIRELGRGGMGMVWAARDVKLGRRVAIKFLLDASRGVAERFLVEARATAHCSHDNIVIIHEVDEIDDMPYMVLEFLEGHNLRDVIAGQRLPASRVVELALPIARALARAHELGIVHRDLKPENVFVTTAGQVKVLDFGIAKALGAAEHIRADAVAAGMHGTRAGTLVGTLPYMSPEQMGVDEVDHRTDIWALGIMMFEMLSGRHPIGEITVEGLFHAVTSDAPLMPIASAVPGLRGDVAAIVDACLRKTKKDRPDQLVDKLEALLPGRHGRTLADGESPFPGLTAFDEADADRFFGRAREVVRMMQRVRERPITAVVGPSGAGKSSFVRAGVVPALRASGEAWEIATLRPGRQPFAALASVLGADADQLRREPGHAGSLLRARARATGGRVLVFVDQMEELYTLVPAKEAKAFTTALAAIADDAATPVRVVVSMRSDFLDRVEPRLMEELSRGLEFLPPPDKDGLREALRAPLELVGYHYESATIVEDMVEALAGTPGALPLLQFAAAKLWDARDRQARLLTVASYTAIGGVTGALATHADEVVALMSGPAQKVAHKMFRRLVTPERTRAIVELDDLVELAPARAEGMRVIDQLVDARLLVVQKRDAGGSVEIVHESLIERWPTLRRWLDEDQEDAAFLAQLAAAAKQWDGKGRPAGLLWSGDAIDEARRWQAQRPREIGDRDRAFLDAAFRLSRRSQRIRRGALAGAFVLLGAIAAVASVAYVQVNDTKAKLEAEKQQRDKADRDKELAAKAADEAEVRRAAAARDRDAETEKARLAKEAETKVAAEKAVVTSDLGKEKQNTADLNKKLQDDVVRLEAEKRELQKTIKRAEDAEAEAKKQEANAKANAANAEKALAIEREHNEKGKEVVHTLKE